MPCFGRGMRNEWRLALAFLAAALPVAPQWDKYEEIPFMATPVWVIDEMLKMAGVTAKDIVYDLGSGEGDIVIRAAQKCGARGVGIEFRPELVQKSRQNARDAKVADEVRFIHGDFFYTDIREATVVTLFLLPEVNRALRPKLLTELKPGSRIVAHAFPIPDWKPDKFLEKDGRKIFLWIVPAP
jgi:ubiquinone/menaquinone biosynthesis C-methylase UbiE